MRQRNSTIVTLGNALVLTLCLAVIGCTNTEDSNPPTDQNIEFRPDGVLDFIRPDSSLIQRVVIEIAEDTAARNQGLMYRRTMAERMGMLFIFPGQASRSFWMLNTPLSLDILFVDPDGRIINIVKGTTPFSKDPILSTEPAQYVVEVRAGFTNKYKIAPGDLISWERRTFETN